MTMISPQTKQCAFHLDLLLSPYRKDRLKPSLVSLVCSEDEDFFKEIVKLRLQFLCTRMQGNS